MATLWNKLPLQKGEYALIGGLKTESFNGRYVEVVDFIKTKSRFKVRLEDDQSVVLIKPMNLCPAITIRNTWISDIIFPSYFAMELEKIALGTSELSFEHLLAFRENFEILKQLQPLQVHTRAKYLYILRWCIAVVSFKSGVHWPIVKPVLDELLDSCDSGGILVQANILYTRMVLHHDNTRQGEMFTRMRPWFENHYGYLFVIAGLFYYESLEYMPELFEMARKRTYAAASSPENLTHQMGFLFFRDYCLDGYLISDKEIEGIKELKTICKFLDGGPNHYGEVLCKYVDGDYKGCVKLIVAEQGRGSIVIPKASQCLLLMKCYCFWKMRDVSGARKALKHLRRFHPDCAELERVDKRISKMKNRSKSKQSGTWLKQCSNIFCVKKETVTREFLACARCRKEFYCSQQCQKKHWKTSHQLMCRKSV